jgi:hypothetical protein
MSIQVRAKFAEFLVAKIYHRQRETVHFGATSNEDIPCYFRFKVYNVGTQFNVTVLLIEIEDVTIGINFDVS